MANFSQNLGSIGLGSISFTAPAAGIYHLQGSTNLSMLSQDASQPAPPSSVPAIGSAPEYQSSRSLCVMTVSQNASPIYVGAPGATGFMLVVSCALNDVLNFANSSSAPVDQPPNAVKTMITIWS